MPLLETVSLAAFKLVALLSIFMVMVHRISRSRAYPSTPGPRAAPSQTGGSFEKFTPESSKNGRCSSMPYMLRLASPGKVLRVAPQIYSISDPASLPIMYSISNPMPKSNYYKSFGDPLIPNHNLFSATDPIVQAGMRRKVAGLYSMTAISKYEVYVDSYIQLLPSKFDRLAEGDDHIDLQRWMQCYALDVIGEITYGFRVGFLESKGRDIDGIITDLDKMFTLSTLMGIDKKSVPLLLLTNGNPISVLERWINKAAEARARLEKEGRFAGRKAGDFYSKMQVMKEKDPEGCKLHKVDAALTANIGAGSDTTSISLTATLLFLTESPSALRKLRAEIIDAVNRDEADNSITFEQAQKLPYLQAVIKEALILWPATELPFWQVVQKPGATIAGNFFPPGTIVGANPWVVDRDPTVFGPDADAFRPERWIDSSADQLKEMDHCFITFSLGTRSCLRKHVSILEMTKIVPELVKRYDFEILEPQIQTRNHWFVKPVQVYARIRKAELESSNKEVDPAKE